MTSVKQGGIIFESLVWLNLGLNPGLPDHSRILNSLGKEKNIVICDWLAI